MLKKASVAGFLSLLLFVWVTATLAQTAVPPPTATTVPTPIPTSTPIPTPTEPPAILIIQPTPLPTQPLQGNILNQFQQVWEQNKPAILLAILTTLITGVLIGVFLKKFAESLSEGIGKLFSLLFDRIAAAPLIRLRYEKKYRQTVAASVQELQGGNLVDREIKLDQMYVPSLLTEEMQPDAPVDLVDRYRTRDEMRRRQQGQSVDAWEAIRRFHRFVVLGGPGAGKTTYLYHLAFMCAHKQKPEVENHIPIFIRFREIVRELDQYKRLEDIFPRIFAENNFPNAEQFIDTQLKRGRCLILLDGLDEVPSEDNHKRLIEMVQGFANRYLPGDKKEARQNILVISSRKYSYEHGMQLRGFPKTEVMEFSTPAIERFAHNWFGTANPLAEEMLTTLKGNKRFLELARNPLLLLLISDYYERDRNLPDLRAELYQRCIRARITRWNEKRGTHQGRFGENIKMRLLRQLSLHIFENEQKGLLWHSDLLDWMERFAITIRLPENSTPKMLLNEVVRASGLIQEWAIDRYGFSHQTLQEFFAAEAIDRLGAEEGAELLEKFIGNPAWKEVILLYAGLADNANPLLRRLLTQARQPDAPYTLWLLAANCLAEGAQAVSEPIRQELTETLIDRLSTTAPSPMTAAENKTAIIHLKQFAGDMLGQHVQDLLARENATDLLLAAQLLPDGTEATLKNVLNRRLARLSQTADADQRQAAVAAMGRVGAMERAGGADVASVNALLAGLADPDTEARAEACLALGRLGMANETVVNPLLQLYETDAQDAPRHAALEALLALGQAEKLEMVSIPAGEFLMGSEKEQQSLYLPAYFMDRTPVTNAQYRQFMEAGGYATPSYWAEAIAANRWEKGQYINYDDKPFVQPRYWDDKKWNGNTQPVVGVSWYEAMAYARWAGKRLPTEAEWEKAARGTDGRTYPWDNEWQAKHANSKEAGHEQTTPVGQYSPQGDSPYGLVDMAGNVWEWCSTRWRDEKKKEYNYPYTPDDGREDLSGGDDVARVLRGGSWANDKKSMRCAARVRFNPDSRLDLLGFCCCCATSSLSPGSDS